MLTPLTAQFQVVGVKLRPLWDTPPPPESLTHWQTIADDLIQAIETLSTPIYAVGHSLGAVATLLAARQRPELFAAVVALDPVLFPRWLVWAMTAGPRWIPRPEPPLFAQTLRRRRHWESREAAFDRFRSKPTFAKWSDATLWSYVKSITAPDADAEGVRLLYSPEWETRIYRTGFASNRGWWRWIRDITVPVTVVRGSESDTFQLSAVKLWQKIRPDFALHEIVGGGHLFPLEFPETSAAQIRRAFDPVEEIA